ncbi:hypothetical protein [Desulfosarcina variabilis]|uniref:hypothetical protein n=1 Tax=Desulfosarcina variabilis TaxID=2300 RepID=UPI003AFA2E1D
MYSNGGGIGITVREKAPKLSFPPKEEERRYKNGKAFVRCLCPKCNVLHNVYMLWTGRGMPRKYCVNCKPLVSGYDEAAFYEAAISTSGHTRRKGKSIESE